jgi:diadenosine tetraphosphate (Ap4A) HIT family hydrolase
MMTSDCPMCRGAAADEELERIQVWDDALWRLTVSLATEVLKEATGAPIVYVYIFGDGVAHLHVHLAPHRAGDALNDQMIRGEVVEEKLPSGMTRVVSREFPALPREHALDVAERIRDLMTRG